MEPNSELYEDQLTPVETPAWRKMSLQAPYFADLADQLAIKLYALGHQMGKMLCIEAKLLAEGFREWVTAPPTDNERRELINAMCSFNMRAQDLLSGSRNNS